jgi:hypothetical protein
MTKLEEITTLIDEVIEANGRYMEYNGHPVMQPHYKNIFIRQSGELGRKLDELAVFERKADKYKAELDRMEDAFDEACRRLYEGAVDSKSFFYDAKSKDWIALQLLAFVDEKAGK